jgi:hypothetical protein
MSQQSFRNDQYSSRLWAEVGYEDQVIQLNETVAYSALVEPAPHTIALWADQGTGTYPLTSLRGGTETTSITVVPETGQIADVDKIEFTNQPPLTTGLHVEGSDIYYNSLNLSATSPALNIYTADGAIADPIRNVDIGTNTLNFVASNSSVKIAEIIEGNIGPVSLIDLQGGTLPSIVNIQSDNLAFNTIKADTVSAFFCMSGTNNDQQIVGMKQDPSGPTIISGYNQVTGVDQDLQFVTGLNYPDTVDYIPIGSGGQVDLTVGTNSSVFYKDLPTPGLATTITPTSVYTTGTLGCDDEASFSNILFTDLEAGFTRTDVLAGKTTDYVSIGGNKFDRGIQVYDAGSKPLALPDVLWVNNLNSNHLYHNDYDLEAAASGDVVGPASAVNNAIPLFDTTTGKLIKDSGFGIKTTGTNNMFLSANGSQAGLTTGTNNTSFGNNALNSITTGSRNCVFGNGASPLSTSSFNMAAFGYSALGSQTAGTNNSAFGYTALGALTNGAENVAVGTSSLSSLIGASRNTGCGLSTLAAITTGTDNVAVGWRAGFNLTGNDNNNILIGTGVLGSTGDVRVIRIGSVVQTSCFIAGIYGISPSTPQMVTINSSGQMGSQAIPTGTGDVVGPASATDTAIAIYNTTTGKLIKNSLATIDATGIINIPLAASIRINSSPFLHHGTNTNSIYCGVDCSNFTASGGFNACLGTQAGLILSSGQSNTCIGYRAGSIITTGSNNIMIGNQAGLTMGGTFNNNIYLGDITGFFGESGAMRLGGPSTVETVVRGIYGNTLTTPQITTVTADGHLGSTTVVALSNNYTITNVTTTPYSVLTTDTKIIVDTSGGAMVLNLPAATNKMNLVITDNGNALINNITINRAGADTIVGGTSLTTSTNYGTYNLFSDGVSKWYIQ